MAVATEELGLRRKDLGHGGLDFAAGGVPLVGDDAQDELALRGEGNFGAA